MDDKLRKIVRRLQRASSPREKAEIAGLITSPAIFKKVQKGLSREALRDIAWYHPKIDVRNLAEEAYYAPQKKTHKLDISDAYHLLQQAGIPTSSIKKPTKNSLMLIFPSRTTGALLKFDAGVAVVGKLDKQHEIEDAKPVKLDDKLIVRILQTYRKLDYSIDDRAKSLRGEGDETESAPKQAPAPEKTDGVKKPLKEKGPGGNKGNATSDQSAMWYTAKSISRAMEEVGALLEKEGLSEEVKLILEQSKENLLKLYRAVELKLKR